MNLANRIKNKSLLSGKFKLRSGKISDQYFDKYLFESDPKLLLDVCVAMSKILPSGYEKLAALEMGGIPIGTILSQITNVDVLFIRKEAKEYGTCKFAEGGQYIGSKLLIIEDVVSTGGAIIDAINKLKSDGADIIGVACVIDRETGGRQNIESLGIPFVSLLTYGEIMKSAQQGDAHVTLGCG